MSQERDCGSNPQAWHWAVVTAAEANVSDDWGITPVEESKKKKIATGAQKVRGRCISVVLI